MQHFIWVALHSSLLPRQIPKHHCTPRASTHARSTLSSHRTSKRRKLQYYTPRFLTFLPLSSYHFSVKMDSAKIFALGLAAGLAIHVVMRKQAKKPSTEEAGSKSQVPIASKSSKKSKNKKKGKDATPVVAASEPSSKVEPADVQPPAAAVVGEQAPVAIQTASQKKKNKKSKQQQQQQSQPAAETSESYAAVAETTPAINNDTIRAKADAAQTAFTTSLGDMRDADVDPLPAGYSAVARIPAPEVATPKPKLSKKELDDGWSNVGGTFPSSSASSSAAAKLNGSSNIGSSKANGVTKSSIASTNPFAALPDDATTSSVRRIPVKSSSANGSGSNGSGWTVASPSASRPKATSTDGAVSAETKKQRSNANKAQAKKQAKEEADRLQAERLANHRRQQATEAAKQREAAARPAPKSVPGSSSKLPQAKASVDLNGRLVWD